MKNQVFYLLLAIGATSCAIFRPSDPSNIKKVNLTRPDGTKVACFRPPADVYTDSLGATIDAKIPYIREKLEASLTIENKVERIRTEIPNLQALEAVEFRMCVAYGNNAINSDQYAQFISEILPLLQKDQNANN